MLRAADANTLAPSVDYYSPKDYHYCQWGLSNITDSGDDLLSFDEVKLRKCQRFAAVLLKDSLWLYSSATVQLQSGQSFSPF